MTVSATEPVKVTANGNGVATVFSFSPMVLYQSADIKVIFVSTTGVETVLSLGTGATNYSLQVSPFPGTGTITYPAHASGTKLQTGEKLVMSLNLLEEQLVDLLNQGGYFPDVQETIADKQVKLIKMKQEVLDRAIKLPAGETGGASVILPPAAQRINKTLIFDGSGNPTVGNASISGTFVSAFGATVVDDADAAAFVATQYAGEVSPAQITSDQNNYAPAGLGTVNVLRINSDAQRAITGITTGADGRHLEVYNTGSFSIFLLNENAGSTAGNRFSFAGDLQLSPNSGVVLKYDSDTSRWRSPNPVINEPPDSVVRVTGSSDATKKLAFEVDGLTTATTRKRFISDEDAPLAQPWEIVNGTFTVTVAANALTVALKTKKGTDPTADDPVFVKFRNTTLGTGDYTTLAVTSALSVTLSSGSTLGTQNSIAHRIYFGIANDAGTPRLFAYHPLSAGTLPAPTISLLGITEGLLYSSTAEGGAGAADSAQVLYSSIAFSNKAVRLLGYFESTQTTAGTWAAAPSKIHILHPYDPRPGDLVQRILRHSGGAVTGTTVMVLDDTIPQNTEGVEFLTQAITPSSAINLLLIRVQVYMASSTTNGSIMGAIFQDSTADAIAAVVSAKDSVANAGAELIIEHMMLAGTTSSTTFKIRAGVVSAGTVTFNGDSGTRNFGGIPKSNFRIDEIWA